MKGAPVKEYRLLDTGRGRRLEQVGPFRLDRQATQAFWSRRLPEKEWQRADGFHHRSETGGGHWEFHRRLPASWQARHGGFLFEIRPTPFGHIGLFPEQADQWSWLQRVAAPRGGGEPWNILNLFAYTGGSTLALARAGARVCHVDASRGMVDQARRNAAANDLAEAPVRWIVDDVMGFLRREERRGRRYDGVVLDPPSFGRGRKREIFKIDEDLPSLLSLCRSLVGEAPHLALLTCHTPGYTPLVLRNMLEEAFPGLPAGTEAGEMIVAESASARPLPSGAWCRFARESAE